MKLVTKTLEKVFEKFPLYSQDGKPIDEKKVLCKYFTPWGANTWIVTEASRNEEKPGDWDFFGVVTLGYEWEWGYFSLSELQGIRGQFGLGVERERYGIDPGKKTVYEVLKAEGNGGAEFAEEMLEWEREEEAQDAKQPETKPEPEEVQPEAEQTQPEQEPEEWPEPLPVLPEDWPEIVLENYDYSPEDAQRIYDEGAPENWEEIRPDIWRRTKSNGWAIDDGDLELLAKNFIKGVQDNDARRVCWTYEYLEDINFHTENKDFLDGKAANYIHDKPQPAQPEKQNLNHIIGQFFYAEQEYTFPRRSVHKDNIKITDVDAEKVHYKIVDKKLNEWSKLGAPLGCGFMSIESFISGLAAGTIYAIKPAAPVIRIVTESAAPFAVLVDD